MGNFTSRSSDWKISKGSSFAGGEGVRGCACFFKLISRSSEFGADRPLIASYFGVGVGVDVGILSWNISGSGTRALNEAASRSASELSRMRNQIGGRIETLASGANGLNDVIPNSSEYTDLSCMEPFSADDLNGMLGGFGSGTLALGAAAKLDIITGFKYITSYFSLSDFDSGIDLKSGISGYIGIWKVWSEPLPRAGNLYYAQGFVDTLFLDVRPAPLVQEERDRFIEGQLHCINLQQNGYHDNAGRSLQIHILHYYFLDLPHLEHNPSRVNRNELVRRITRFLDRNPGRGVEWGFSRG